MPATWEKLAFDADVVGLVRIAGIFAPHEQASPNMTVRLDAGALPGATDPLEVAAQSTGTITAPAATYGRIDRVVIDAITGTVSVITGTPIPGTPVGASAAPDIATGKLPVCRVLLASTTTAITNDLITDERVIAYDVVKHSLATAANDFLVASGSGVFVKKTLAETKTILGVTAGGSGDFLVMQVFS